MMMTEQLLSMILELGVAVWDEHQLSEQQHEPWKDDGFLAGTKEDVMGGAIVIEGSMGRPIEFTML
jgi:hypothetical protein